MAIPTLGLPVSKLVRVDVFMSPQAAATRSFGSLLICGDSDVIDVTERIRQYDTAESVGLDFGADSPEYKAAVLYYSQRPRPADLYIGRWATEPTQARLNGALLDEYQTAIAIWQAISNGGFDIAIDGTNRTITGLDFSGVSNLNAVAGIVTDALAGMAVCVWNATLRRFEITNSSTGSTSVLGYASKPSYAVGLATEAGQQINTEAGAHIIVTSGSGATDISGMLGLAEGMAYSPVDGIDSETPEECAMRMVDLSADWYGLMFAARKPITTAQHVDVAALIEASEISHIYGITTDNKAVLDASITTDIASRLRSLSYQRSFVDFSTTARYTAAAIFGRAFSVNFRASNSTITLMFKEQVGVPSEKLSAQQAATLKRKNCNVFVLYNNGKAILQHGTMAGGWFFDERHGLDWLQNLMQTEVFNLLYTSNTKIPQTEQGMGYIETTLAKCCGQALTNGLIAPGIWNSDPIGDELDRGAALSTGFYIYHQPIADQFQSDREQRKAPVFQVALKLAGAVHSVDVLVAVNR